MRTPHTGKLVSGALGLIALACVWFYFAPVGIGGSTTYVVTDGVSMEPRFHTGDLALVRSQSDYRVGEIVAYRSTAFHTIVLHRIVGRAGARYRLKGDNNNFVDFELPARAQIMGALWLRIPGAGARLRSLRSPGLIAALVGVGTLLFAGAAFARRGRRRRRQRRTADSGRSAPRGAPLRSATPLGGALAIWLVAASPLVALAVVAFSRPPTALLPSEVSYRQSGTLSYSAHASPGPIYPGDRATTGDPLFSRVVGAIQLRFAYRFGASDPHSLAGKAALYASVASTSGWRTAFQVGPPTYFRGDRAIVTASLDLTSLLALLRHVEDTTAVSGSYTLTLVPHVSAAGSLDGLPLRTTFSPQIRFAVTQLEVQPAPAPGGSLTAAQSSATPFAPSAVGSVTGRREQPLFLSLGVARLSVGAARWIAVGGIAALLCALLAGRALIRPRRRDESEAILARYGRLIVPVARVWHLPELAVIDVADIEALVRIAEHYDRSILHENDADGEAFWVTDESGQFRYALSAPTWAAEENAEVQDTIELPLSDFYADEPGREVSVFDARPSATRAREDSNL